MKKALTILSGLLAVMPALADNVSTNGTVTVITSTTLGSDVMLVIAIALLLFLAVSTKQPVWYGLAGIFIVLWGLTFTIAWAKLIVVVAGLIVTFIAMMAVYEK